MTRIQETISSLSLSRCAVFAAVLSLAGCGGGGGGGGGPINPAPPPAGPTWTAGLFEPSAKFANQCANPRTGNDSSGRPFPDVKGTVLTENHWLRSWTNELYLWYSEVQDRNPADFATADYFNQLKTPALTPSGNPKDQFHFTYPTSVWDSFSQSGVSAGYGANFAIVSGQDGQLPRKVLVALVEANTPAAAAGLLRGDEIVTVDGVDVAYGSNVTTLNNGLFPNELDKDHAFVIRRNNVSSNLTLRSASVTSTPVHTVKTLSTPSGNVGYILFNDHIATAEAGLINAINTLRTQNIQDLVLDVRYNGGGYLAIASQLSYMIAGDAQTAGRFFERTIFNDKHTATNPVTGRPLEPTPFYKQTLGISANTPAGAPLPTLNLPRVFVLTTDDTCSASEAIINGLKGVDFPVIQIGSATCGKPYGFYDFDNCGTTYFSIQFKGVNAKNFGDYADGFLPTTSASVRGDQIEGCPVADDYSKQLGDPTERMLSVALSYRGSNACSLPPSGLSQKLRRPEEVVEGEVLSRPAWREMKILDLSF
ncbi:MAG TPA: S41 family peptidase [Steroidobacteraceae bacterium]|nr:S41 family peptidase [Steroidobacteraceae bacterium]